MLGKIKLSVRQSDSCQKVPNKTKQDQTSGNIEEQLWLSHLSSLHPHITGPGRTFRSTVQLLQQIQKQSVKLKKIKQNETLS